MRPIQRAIVTPMDARWKCAIGSGKFDGDLEVRRARALNKS